MLRFALAAFIGFAFTACGPQGEDSDVGEEVTEALMTPTLFGLQNNQLTRIDPATGALTVIATVPAGTSQYPTMGVAVPSTRRFYQVGAEAYMRTFNSDTGALLDSVQLYTQADIERTSNGHLVGRCPIGAAMRFCRVNLATFGALDVLNYNMGTHISPYPGTENIGSAYDPATNLYFMSANLSGSNRLLGINSDTGGIVTNAPFPTGVVALRVNAQGQLIGTRWNGSSLTFLRIDPQSGAVTWLSNLINLQSSAVIQRQALDRATNRLYQIVTDVGGTQRIYTLDATSGATLSSAPIAGVWQGLHTTLRETGVSFLK